ncbi:MAG: hypothetical protein IIY93_02910, partial [Clostridia bacterium]|nr:hypothetical protein [Clostridia bacterium]
AFKQMCQISALTSKVVELGSVVSIQKHEIEELHRQIDEMKGQYEPDADDMPMPADEPVSAEQPAAVEVVID